MMYRYAVLANPGHNRVYFSQSQQISAAELEIACRTMDKQCGNFAVEEIGGIRYYTFESQKALEEAEVKKLSMLSCFYALFERCRIQNAEYLRPVAKAEYNYFSSDLSTILKYTGKTNELFTRMMIQVALNTSVFSEEKEISLLDPVCGKGTTLFEGLICGYQVSGIEVGPKVVHDTCTYFKKYLESQKCKHQYQKQRISGEQRSFTAEKNEFLFARTKEEFKDPQQCKRMTVVAGNSRYADRYFKKNAFHIVVGDLPYGVVHGNVTNEKPSSQTRNPGELLTACLPSWKKVLKPGGAIVLAWNKFVLPAEQAAAIFEQNGLEVKRESPYNQFEHRVDQSIKRDILVAVKPKGENC